MIDQNLIANNVISLSKAFLYKKKISDQLYTIENVLTADALAKLYDYILNQSDKPWELETTEKYQAMQVPRRKISWHAETVIEELHEVMAALTPRVIETIQKNCEFHGLVLWEDREGYEIAWHSDNPILIATCQIYLAGSTHNPGTEFEIGNDLKHICPFAHNTGYFIDQSLVRPKHRTTGPVPSLATRYSLFGMWK